MAPSSDEQEDNLALLRRTFPDWVISIRFVGPRWQAVRNQDSYGDRPAVVTEIRATDPNELYLLLAAVADAEKSLEEDQ